MRTLTDVIGIVMWCLAVYVCMYDWDQVRAREEIRRCRAEAEEKRRTVRRAFRRYTDRDGRK